MVGGVLKLSIVIIARDEEKIIKDCLESAKWADEIVLVDTGSADKTFQIAKKYGAKIIKLPVSKEKDFSKWRNEGLKAAQGEWILYIDADERVTPELKKEIQEVITKTEYEAYEIPRRNYYLGKEMHYGGAWPDYVRRLFLKKKLKGWQEKLHEHPVVDGEWGRLESPLIHQTHRDLSSMVEKTREWSKIEAELLFKNYSGGHPPVTWWRILRIMLTEFWHRGIKLQGLRDGTVGWIEVIFQMFSRFITYARLWELQQKKK